VEQAKSLSEQEDIKYNTDCGEGEGEVPIEKEKMRTERHPQKEKEDCREA